VNADMFDSTSLVTSGCFVDYKYPYCLRKTLYFLQQLLLNSKNYHKYHNQENYNPTYFFTMRFFETLSLLVGSMSLFNTVAAVDAYFHNKCSFGVWVQSADGSGHDTGAWQYVGSNNAGYKSPLAVVDGAPGKSSSLSQDLIS
jgi:hypothetical protein